MQWIPAGWIPANWAHPIGLALLLLIAAAVALVFRDFRGRRRR